MKGESQNGKKSKRILILFINLAYEEIAFMENKSLLLTYDSFKSSFIVNFYISDLIAPIIWKGPSNIFFWVGEGVVFLAESHGHRHIALNLSCIITYYPWKLCCDQLSQLGDFSVHTNRPKHNKLC